MKPSLLLAGISQETEQTYQMLRLTGMEVNRCGSARQARMALVAAKPNVLVIQVSGERPSEWQEAERLMESAGGVPALVLVDSPRMEGRLAGFAIGADDVMSAPFHPAELRARVESLLRRQPGEAPREALRHGPLELRPLSHEVLAGGHPVPLTPSEFELLQLLLQWPGRVFTREQLAARVHHPSERRAGNRAVDVLIAGLRRKLGASPEARSAIETVRGVGYRLRL